MTVFVDASYFLALADPRDRWHPEARKLRPWAKARAPLHTTALVVAEVIAITGARFGGKAAQGMFDAIQDDCVTHFPSPDELEASMVLVVRYDGGLSLADAYTLHAMDATGSRQVLSFDEDFDGKGVQRIVRPPGRGGPGRGSTYV